ncbi:TonB-dependent receptor plug domain-containing protein [Tardiphaga sp. 215_C5_N2_1]|uniref:TonB-dependent receptor plug domain-containing protein n=1 Tax=unclassified Tardiphaga TaxID=2631404 RepID=UPI0008A80988|nr:TonB-dependent receptor [Tardiphaga sp. OK245]SEH47135.1 vitamin B12 transporter [Tardiphaga sp. OK245]
MTIRNLAAGTAAVVVLSCSHSAAHAQSSAEQLSEIVVTADRAPEQLNRTGSSISVVSGETIATSNPGSLVDALRTVPGLDISENGGPGGTANVRLRGGNTGQTLVMIDGIRVNDPTAASGDFEFAMFTPSAMERIEVLKGPQSALYGSDAMGGVINIITKKGSGPAQVNVRTEAGSYGTVMTQGSLTGTNGPWSYAFTGGGQHSNGFSRYGYRIPALEARFPNLENDSFDRVGGSARIGYDAGEGIRLESGIVHSFTRAAYDAASGTYPDTGSSTDRLLQTVYGRVGIDSFGGVLTHNITVSNTHTERSFNELSYPLSMRPPPGATARILDYWGNSLGAEYQATLKLGAFGSLIYGAKTQSETAQTFTTGILPTPTAMTSTLSKRQDTNSVFALWSVPIGERLNITLGGRVDDVVDVARFETWRATAAYNITETGTKFHASAGTGAKAPTLFQLYSQANGTPSLSPETNFGYDAGIDQSLFNGRVVVSVTGFATDYSNLINFVSFTPSACAADQKTGCYNNVARAETSGLEVGANVDVIPGLMKFNAAYTYLHAQDLGNDTVLARRPKNFARFALTITPTDKWMIEPRVTTVSKRFSSANQVGQVDAYTRVDLYTEYKIDANWKVFARGENILNEHYQEVLNFGTTGPAAYAGFNATW